MDLTDEQGQVLDRSSSTIMVLVMITASTPSLKPSRRAEHPARSRSAQRLSVRCTLRRVAP